MWIWSGRIPAVNLSKDFPSLIAQNANDFSWQSPLYTWPLPSSPASNPVSALFTEPGPLSTLGTCWTLFCPRTFASALPSTWILQDELMFRFHQAFPEYPIWDDFPSPCLLFPASVPWFLLQSISTIYHFYYVWKVKVLVAQSSLTLYDPMDYSPPGFPVHRVFQARILEWVAIPFSKGSSQPRDQIWVSCIASGFFTI